MSQSRSLIFIHGGDSFESTAQFRAHLATTTLRDPAGPRVSTWWCDRLRAEVGDVYQVLTPKMPNSDNAQYEEWKLWFERYLEHTTGALTLIGWSLGGMFLAKYLTEQTLPHPLERVVLLGAPCASIVDDTGNTAPTFACDVAALPQIMDQTPELHIWHSDDDFVVPVAHAQQFVAAVPAATLRRFTNYNHFLVPELPELVALLRSIAP